MQCLQYIDEILGNGKIAVTCKVIAGHKRKFRFRFGDNKIINGYTLIFYLQRIDRIQG
jgi:hypothetical protein